MKNKEQAWYEIEASADGGRNWYRVARAESMSDACSCLVDSQNRDPSFPHRMISGTRRVLSEYPPPKPEGWATRAMVEWVKGAGIVIGLVNAETAKIFDAFIKEQEAQ